MTRVSRSTTTPPKPASSPHRVTITSARGIETRKVVEVMAAPSRLLKKRAKMALLLRTTTSSSSSGEVEAASHNISRRKAVLSREEQQVLVGPRQLPPCKRDRLKSGTRPSIVHASSRSDSTSTSARLRRLLKKGSLARKKAGLTVSCSIITDTLK